jgi:hypothetical protein
MPVTITCLPDEPIVVAEFHGRMDLNSIRLMFQESARFADLLNQKIYRIVNYLNADASFRDMAAALAEAKKGGAGSPRDPRLFEVMVARRNRIRYLLDVLSRKEYGSIDVPVFDTMDDGFAFVRAQCRDTQAEMYEMRV